MVVINELLNAGAKVRIFDPVAMEETAQKLGDKVTFCKNPYDAVDGADAVALITEWKPFRLINWSHIKQLMKGNVVVDGRNIYDPAELKAEGLNYYSIGKKH